MKSLSHVRLPATPWTSAHQALPSMGYSRQEYWSGVPVFSLHLQYRRPQFASWVGKFPEKRDRLPTPVFMAFPGGSDSKESTCNAGDLGLVPGLGRSPGGGHGNPFSYSCLENPMDRGAWEATAHGVTKSRTQLSD